MKRRNLLKSLGAVGALPLVPSLPVSTMTTAPANATNAVATVSEHTYKWAEMIVRAHSKCTPGMLERLLQVDTQTASALKSQLLKNGIINAKANAFGVHAAVNPLYEGAFVRPSSQISKGLEKASDILDEMMEPDDQDQEINTEIKSLNDETESIEKNKTLANKPTEQQQINPVSS